MMSASHNRLSYLFHRYYNARATDPEINELMELVRKSGNDDMLAELTRAAWEDLKESDEGVFPPEVTDRVLNSIIPSARMEESGEEDYDRAAGNAGLINPWWRKYSVAAAVALIFLAGGWWKWHNGRKGDGGAAIEVQADIRPGANRATLTLADGSVIRLADVSEGIISRQGDAEIKKLADGEIAYKLAGSPVQDNRINTVSTPRGGQFRVSLPDGSMVWLNASSLIRFPTGFAADERRVEVEGEVFFEVKKDAARPFRVVFGGNEVEVLGTSFNITHYPDEAVSRTTLVEGSVSLQSGGKANVLKPGQEASIAVSGAVKIAEVDVEEVIAWKNGLFYFKETDIGSIMRQVSRWYDVEVSYDGEIPEKQFTGKVRRSVELSDFMEMLEYAGVNYRVHGRQMTIIP